MKSNSSIYILLNSPGFNKEAVSKFESFSKDDSISLNSSLILNHKEILSKLPKTIRITFNFDNHDKDFLPEELKENGFNINFSDTSDKKNLLNQCCGKIF